MWWRIGNRWNDTARAARDISKRVDDLTEKHHDQSVALSIFVDKLADTFRKSAKEARLALGIQLALVTATITSVLVATWQANSLQSQNDLASQARLQEIKTADLDFVASIDVSASPTQIRISNRSNVPVRSSALWLLERFDKTERLQEMYGPIEGVPPCGELSIPRSTIIDSVRPEGGTSTKVDNSHPNRQEAYLVVKAPSGEWFRMGDKGIPSEIGSDSPDPVRALKSSDLYSESADTYWETYSKVNVYSFSTPVVSGKSVTGDWARGKLSGGSC